MRIRRRENDEDERRIRDDRDAGDRVGEILKTIVINLTGISLIFIFSERWPLKKKLNEESIIYNCLVSESSIITYVDYCFGDDHLLQKGICGTQPSEGYLNKKNSVGTRYTMNHCYSNWQYYKWSQIRNNKGGNYWVH